jgi:hypothetical protein
MPDARFDRLQSDPRFRRPKKHAHKVVVDARFKSVLGGSSKKRDHGGASHPHLDKHCSP